MITRTGYIIAFALLLTLSLSGVAASDGGRDPGYITDIDWLKNNLDSDGLVVLDARPPKDYAAGHIPGALNVGWEDFANVEGKPGDKGWGVMLQKPRLAAAFAALGIDRRAPVVVYADPRYGWGEDGRFVWMLRTAGVSGATILDGGFDAWKSSGYPTSTIAAKPRPSPFTIRSLRTDLVADTGWIQGHMRSVKIIDARTREEYDGAVNFGETRGGHLPGAILVPFKNVFRADGRLKNPAELDALFSTAGVEKTDDIVVYCTAGIRSAHMTLVLRMAGYSKTRNYDESFYRWAAIPSLKVE